MQALVFFQRSTERQVGLWVGPWTAEGQLCDTEREALPVVFTGPVGKCLDPHCVDEWYGNRRLSLRLEGSQEIRHSLGMKPKYTRGSAIKPLPDLAHQLISLQWQAHRGNGKVGWGKLGNGEGRMGRSQGNMDIWWNIRLIHRNHGSLQLIRVGKRPKGHINRGWDC